MMTLTIEVTSAKSLRFSSHISIYTSKVSSIQYSHISIYYATSLIAWCLACPVHDWCGSAMTDDQNPCKRAFKSFFYRGCLAYVIFCMIAVCVEKWFITLPCDYDSSTETREFSNVFFDANPCLNHRYLMLAGLTPNGESTERSAQVPKRVVSTSFL